MANYGCRWSFISLLVPIVCFVTICLADLPFVSKKLDTEAAEQCFCKLQGEVDDCSCRIESIDEFNNGKVFPILNSLLQKDYFRYWKVNLKKECPFWEDSNICTMTDCKVQKCTEEELPSGLRGSSSKYSKEANTKQSCSNDEDGDNDEDFLGDLDSTLSNELKEAVVGWQKHDDAQNTFCEMDDDKLPGAGFVDLMLNPERYTGYKGQGAAKIWSSIYNENCFSPPDRVDYSTYTGDQQKAGMCIEKRTFFRMISGLHTSINVHLSAMYRNSDPLGIRPPSWGANLQEFQRRFDPKTTNGDGPQRLRNLYFAYLVELRALHKVTPYLRKVTFYTGNGEEDKETKKAVNKLLDVIGAFEGHFDESKLFKGDPAEAASLKEDVRLKFHNISRIMDCVGCQKCRLWGKLQVTGMGTALKILFSGDEIGPQSTIGSTSENKGAFQLRRQEIVALFNAFGRFTKSIIEIEQFRNLLKEER